MKADGSHENGQYGTGRVPAIRDGMVTRVLASAREVAQV
jgi:hypothetical protein